MPTSMNDGSVGGDGRFEILLRGIIIGVVLAVVASAGARLVLSQVVDVPAGGLIVVATTLAAFTVGIWAGAPEPGGKPEQPRHRWLHAGAPTAVAGAYASFSTLYQQVYPGEFWAVASLVVAVAVPAYAIGMIPLVLVANVDENDDDDDADPPFLRFGDLLLGLLIGAVSGALLAGLVVLPLTGPGSALMGASALLLLPLALRERAPIARETLLYETVSPFGRLEVTEVEFTGERQPERRLYLNGEEESGELVRSGAPTMAYIAAAESFFAAVTPPGASYLFLGGGAYTLPRRLLERDPRAHAVVVELDPEVMRVAYQYFHVSPRHRITSVNGDARAYLEATHEKRYDRIYVDVYNGQETLPYSLITVEAARAMQRLLTPGGIVGMNLIGVVAGEEIRRPWSVVQSFAEVFPSLAVYTHLGRDYPDAQNLLLAAGVDSGTSFPRTAGVFDLWPREDWPSPAGLVAFHDLFGTDADATIQRRDQAARAGDRRM